LQSQKPAVRKLARKRGERKGLSSGKKKAEREFGRPVREEKKKDINEWSQLDCRQKKGGG